MAKIEALPKSARVLWYLFSMEGMVHNGGIGGFVLQGAAFLIRGAVVALRQVGAMRFADLMQRGVTHVANWEGPQFMVRDDLYRREKSPAWRSHYSRDPDLESTSELDGHEEDQSFFLMEHELRPCMHAWVERHRSEAHSQPLTRAVGE